MISYGVVSIGAASGNGKLSVTGIGADHKVAAFLGDDADYNRIGIDGPIDADSQVSFCHSGSTCWTIGNNADDDAFTIRTGMGAFGTNDKFAILPDSEFEFIGASGDGVTPVTLKIRSTSDIGTWTPYSEFARVDFVSGDSSGDWVPGDTRARIAAVTENATGTFTGLVFYTSSNDFVLKEQAWMNRIGHFGLGKIPTAKLDVFAGSSTVAKFFGSNADGVRGTAYVDDGSDYAAYYAWDENDGGASGYATLYLGSHDGTQGIIVDVDGNVEVKGAISSATLTITASSDVTDVSGINVLFINPGAAVVLGGFVGGVDGQCLEVVCIDDDQNVTLEHEEGIGGATQDIHLHAGADETLDSHFGGWNLVCDGTGWYDTSHAKNV